jgi:hypothetical protein
MEHREAEMGKRTSGNPGPAPDGVIDSARQRAAKGFGREIGLQALPRRALARLRRSAIPGGPGEPLSSRRGARRPTWMGGRPGDLGDHPLGSTPKAKI